MVQNSDWRDHSLLFDGYPCYPSFFFIASKANKVPVEKVTQEAFFHGLA